MKDQQKELIEKYSHLISLRHPCCIVLELSWKYSYFLNKMEKIDTEKDPVYVLNILEAEPVSDSSPVRACHRVLEHQEQLAVLISNWKAKEKFGVSLTQDQVKKLSELDVEKYFKRYLHRLQGLAMQWLIHFFCSHVKHWLVFSLLMKKNFWRN